MEPYVTLLQILDNTHHVSWIFNKIHARTHTQACLATQTCKHNTHTWTEKGTCSLEREMNITGIDEMSLKLATASLLPPTVAFCSACVRHLSGWKQSLLRLLYLCLLQIKGQSRLTLSLTSWLRSEMAPENGGVNDVLLKITEGRVQQTDFLVSEHETLKILNRVFDYINTSSPTAVKPSAFCFECLVATSP